MSEVDMTATEVNRRMAIREAEEGSKVKRAMVAIAMELLPIERANQLLQESGDE